MGGGISRMAKQELVATIRDRYQQASKKDEGRILDEFTAITVGGEFVAVMEDVLDLYPEPCDPQRPVVCFDETSTQLLAETKAHCRRGPDAPGARTTNTCALWHPQPVSHLRAQGRMAPCGDYPTAHHAGLRLSVARAGG